MATTKTIKSSGGDYTSLAAWEDGMDGNLTGTGYSEAVCYALDDGGGLATIYGWTTTASDYITITADATGRHAGVWDGDKYNLVVQDQDNVIGINEDYVRLDGLQLNNHTPTGTGKDLIEIGSSAAIGASNDIRISNCLLVGGSNNSYYQRGINAVDSDIVLYAWNNILYGFGTSASSSNRVINCGGATHYIYSCVGIGGYYGLYRGAGDVTAKNCYFGGSSNLDYEGDFTAVVNCASEDASADDDSATDCLTGVALDTGTFVNVSAGTEDFHLAADGLSPLQSAGVDTSGEGAPLNFTTNIDGEARDATWDIGADSWVASVVTAYNVVMNIL